MMSDTSDEGGYRERHGDEPTGDTGCEGLTTDPDLITAQDVASARHCEIKVDGLPGQLPAGRYAVSFTGMEYVRGGRPVLRFAYQGRLADAAFTPDELTPEEQGRLHMEMAHTRDLATEIFREGEAGIPAGWLPPREEERNTWPTRDAGSPPQPPQQVPDLYQVSMTEVVNVSKLARVVAALLRNGTLTEQDTGELELHGPVLENDVENWLRS